jgi:hypothetical protein
VHYLSWPSWEFFLDPPKESGAQGVYGSFPTMKRAGRGEALLISEPPRFLESLAALRSAPTPQAMRTLLERAPLDPTEAERIKKGIELGHSAEPEAPDRAHLILGLFTLAEIEEREIHELCLRAWRRNQDMLSSLMGPPLDGSEDWRWAGGGGDGGEGAGGEFGEGGGGEFGEGGGFGENEEFGEGGEEGPDGASGPRGLAPSGGGRQFYSSPSGRSISEKQALALQRAWFRLAAPVLLPGDRLWPARAEFRELLARSCPEAEGNKGQYLYHEHSI